MLATLRATLFLAIFLVGSASDQVLGATGQVVCREHSIAGMDISNKNAKSIIGETTTVNKDEVKIYIEYVDEGFYFHSNFCTDGCGKNSFPTKIFVSSSLYNAHGANLTLVLRKLLYHGDSEPISARSEAQALLANSTKIYVDTSMLNEKGAPRLDLSEAKNITIVSGKDKKTVANDVFSFRTRNSGAVLAARILGCCLSGTPPMAGSLILAKLKGTAIETNNLKVASFVADTATMKELKSGTFIEKKLIGSDYITGDKALAETFASAKGTNLFLLGHVEGNQFAVRNAANELLYSVSFEKLRQLATEHNVNVAFIGCKTASDIATETAGAGVVGTFNTVIAAQRLNMALKDSKNLADFLSQLASEDIRIVINSEYANRANATSRIADVYARVAKSDAWIKIAQFFMTSGTS